MAEMRLHASAIPEPIMLRFRDDERYATQTTTDKPVGVWWSVGASWMEWCEGEAFNVGGRVFQLDIDASNVLQISGEDEFDAFHAEFGRAPVWASMTEKRDIDWGRVTARYDGIEIAPYLWSRRHGAPARWYYGWDCASGVTWRPRAVIVNIREVGRWGNKTPIADLLAGDLARVGAATLATA